MKSPLRYPGGKSRAVKILLQFIPEFEEYREPFVGGGSISLALKEQFPSRKYWINDLNTDLYLFWKILQQNPNLLISRIEEIQQSEKDGCSLYKQWKRANPTNELARAIRFYVLNRISFSGTVDAGGYSASAFLKRFNLSAIERLKQTIPILQDSLITNMDYEPLIRASGNHVFLFLDPPYCSTTKSKLYGKRGLLHTHFDHIRFAAVMKTCEHKWLITYDDCPAIRTLFAFAHIYPFEIQYGMNNYRQKRAKKGKEIIITNYPLNPQNRLF